MCTTLFEMFYFLTAYFSPLLNSAVHVLMYTYYMLSAMGPQMKKYLWWKRYMTIIQLVRLPFCQLFSATNCYLLTTFILFQTQFWLIMCHTLIAVYINCGFPSGYGFALILYMLSHILLFSNFYNKAYHSKEKKSA